jgi:hypothetical protein
VQIEQTFRPACRHPRHIAEPSAKVLRPQAGLRQRKRRAAPYIRVASMAELGERIGRYIEMCNEARLVPNWSYGISRHPQPLAA